MYLLLNFSKKNILCNYFCFIILKVMFTLDSRYSLKRRGVLSINDNQFLYNLYLPIIGYKSLFIYEFLVNEYFIGEKENKVDYLIKKTHLKVSDFLNNKKNLESIGLLQTLENGDHYVFILKAILNPNDFFNNKILKELFFNKVGYNNAIKIMKYYEIDSVDFSKYTDISASVNESFELVAKDNENNDLDTEIDLICNNKNEFNDNFDDTKLIEFIAKKSNIDIKEFTNDDIKEMHRLGTLYGLNEDIMGYIMIDGYHFDNPQFKKIDYDYCNRRCKMEISKYKAYNQRKQKITINSKTEFANKINKYETTSPRMFLKEKQSGVEPVFSDLNILSYLAQNMGFSNGVINVIVEYTLNKLDGKLLNKYVEKIAASMKRYGISSALDAYNYLYNYQSKKESLNKNVNEEKNKAETKNNNFSNNDQKEDISDDDIGDLL